MRLAKCEPDGAKRILRGLICQNPELPEVDKDLAASILAQVTTALDFEDRVLRGFTRATDTGTAPGKVHRMLPAPASAALRAEISREQSLGEAAASAGTESNINRENGV
jgi:hypothetical protein